jgi:hypothetical protein
LPNNNSTRVERVARLKWIPIEKMRVSPMAQRELNQARVDHLAANFDPEQIGHPVVSFRDGHFWIIDGQHRVETMKAVGWGDQSVQCEVYEGLSETDEAELFLLRNDTLTVNAFDKFTVGVNAGRDTESDINRIVLANGLVVSRDRIPGAIAAVGTLRRVYRRSDGAILARALRIIRDAYGDPGLEAPVIDGIGHLCQRYNGDLKDDDAIARLAKAHGGVNGLLGKAEQIRRQTGNAKAHCVAAAAVEIINGGRGGKKLPSWWKA